MTEHEKRTALSTLCFTKKKGLSIDDAQAAALVLSFYTGTKSEAVSRGTSLVARQVNEQVVETKTKDEMNETAVILFYLHEVCYHENQHIIYMRQVELDLSKWSVLWVDNNIFDKNWENKQHMETAAAKALNLNVHFIPKSTTNSVLSFLRSSFVLVSTTCSLT
ncbi:unnamed protein product [Rotaria sp. Silwood1]|nr:unnamed protein product [Rotaria sp. Silwood1]